MKILHVIGGLGRDGGGPSRSSQGLVAALRAAGVDAWLMTLGRGENPWIAGVDKFINGGSFEGALDKVRPDVVHLHGIWSMGLHRCAVICRKRRIPYVIAPRGMLEPWSLRQKWLKKRIARFVYQDRDLKKAAALHATAESEAEQFRRLGFKNRIIVSPNGVNVPGRALSTKHQALGTDEKRRALFVSRMHPKKGVLELVESWARVKNEVKVRGEGEQWICELVYTMNSEEERAYEQKVKDRILALGMSYQDEDGAVHCTTTTSDYNFIFTGPLDDEKKWEAYGRADLFVLPTYSENFGIVVAEALWAGIPVITTKGTPWKELEDYKCGWWIDLPSAEVKVKGEGEQWTALDFALREAFEHSNTPNNRTLLHEMGERGRKLVEDRYSWARVAQAMAIEYGGIVRMR